MSHLQRNLSIASRSKLYLIFGFISLILFFYSVSQIAYVIAEPSDLFGLASHFTLPYWIGLALLITCSIFAFLDKELKSDGIYLFILLSLGLYLFGIATLIQENVRNPSMYLTVADVRNLLVTGHTDIVGAYALDFYRAWPGAHFIYASILHVTGTTSNLKELITYVPFFWLLSYIFITYAIGKRFGLSQKYCFLLTFLALSSYWMIQSGASQQGIAALLYLSLFMLVANPNPRNTVAEIILAILYFAALLLTHGLTSLVLVSALFVLSIYRRTRNEATPLVFLFPVLFMAWYMYQAFAAFDLGIRTWWVAPWEHILAMGLRVEGLYDQVYTAAPIVIQKYSSLAYFFVYGIFIAAAIYLLMRHRIKQEDRKWVLTLLMWIIGLGLAGFIYPNREIYIRFLLVGLVPVICIILKVFSSRKLLIPLMLLCLLLFFPARYGIEGYYGQVRSTELTGVRFFTYHTGPVEPWLFYRGGNPDVLTFYNPDIITWPLRGASPGMPSDDLDEASYVLSGKQGSGEEALISSWIQTGRGEEAALIYDNGGFKIYKNRSE